MTEPCGAILLASQGVAGAGSAAAPVAPQRPNIEAEVAKGRAAQQGLKPRPGSSQTTKAESDFEYYFVAERADGSPVHLAYRINTPDKRLHEGLLGPLGETRAFPLNQSGEATFWIPNQ